MPFGLIAVVIGWVALPQTMRLDLTKGFDWPGAVLLMPALTALLLLISQVTAWGASSPASLGCGITAAVLLTLLVWHERTTRFPLLNPKLLREPAFACGCVAIV